MNSALPPSFLATAERRRYSALFLLLLITQLVLLWWLYYAGDGKALIGDEVRYRNVALDILAGGAWHPSTIWPPLQPLLIAGCMALFGAVLWPIQILQTLLWLACAFLLRGLWRRVSGSRRAANAAAALFLLNPSTAAYAQYLWPEMPHLFLLLLVLYALSHPQRRTAMNFLAGIALGAALLTKSLLTGFWPALFAFFVQSPPDRGAPGGVAKPFAAALGPFRLQVRAAAVFVLAALMVTAPALYQGYRSLGRPAIADSSIFNLWVGLNDSYRSDFVRDQTGIEFERYMSSAEQPQARDAHYRRLIADRVAANGVVATAWAQLSRQYFRLFSAKTLLLSQLPGEACAGRLGAYHSSPSWHYLSVEAWAQVLHVLTLLGFAFGLCAWRAWRSRLLWILLLLVGYQLALYFGLHVKARFLLPMLPLFCGFAGSVAVALLHGNAAAPELRFAPLRLAAGALLAVLLLILAYTGPLLDQVC